MTARDSKHNASGSLLGKDVLKVKVDSLKMFYFYFTEKKAQNPDAPSIPPKTISPPKVNPPVNGKIFKTYTSTLKKSFAVYFINGRQLLFKLFSVIYCLPLIMVPHNLIISFVAICNIFIIIIILCCHPFAQDCFTSSFVKYE